MAVTHSRVTVSTSAVALNTASTAGMTLYITNTGANLADLGTSAVTAGTGYSVGANAVLPGIDLLAGEVLFAIRSGGTDAVLSVLRAGG